MPGMTEGRKAFGMASTGNALIVAGGFQYDGRPDFKSAERFSNEEWATVTDMPVSSKYHCLTPITSDKILLIGGIHDGATQDELVSEHVIKW